MGCGERKDEEEGKVREKEKRVRMKGWVGMAAALGDVETKQDF